VGVLVFGLFVRDHDVLDCDVLSRIPYHIRYLNMVCNRSGDGESGEKRGKDSTQKGCSVQNCPRGSPEGCAERRLRHFATVV
jgi:hypothetical protein